MAERTCVRCRKVLPLGEFARDASKATGYKPICRTCDNARCRDYYRHRKHQHCCWCGEATQGQRFCNAICADNHAWERRQAPIAIRTCKICHGDYAAMGPFNRSTCSDDCTREAKRQSDRARARTPERIADMRDRSNKRRAVTLVGDVSRADIVTLLRTRKCPECGVYMTKAYGPRQKQVDHIMPIAVGGTHTLGNLRVICRTCNLSRPDDGSDVAGQTTLWATNVRAVPARPMSSPVQARARRQAKRAERMARAVDRTQENAERAWQALQMRRVGHRWQDIADRLGYANPAGPWLAVKQTLGIDPRKGAFLLRDHVASPTQSGVKKTVGNLNG